MAETPFESEMSIYLLQFVVALEYQYLHYDRQIEQELLINGSMGIAYCYCLEGGFVSDGCLRVEVVLAWLFFQCFVSWEVEVALCL